MSSLFLSPTRTGTGGNNRNSNESSLIRDNSLTASSGGGSSISDIDKIDSEMKAVIENLEKSIDRLKGKSNDDKRLERCTHLIKKFSQQFVFFVTASFVIHIHNHKSNSVILFHINYFENNSVIVKFL
jgi:hypothetical protein